MSGPPPNYDPNASMLHGGTNSVIQPVMGGGGATDGVPSNYNAEASMLSGGNEPIVKILGGGAKTKKTLQGEVYEPFENEETINNRNDYVTRLVVNYLGKKGEMEQYLQNFIQKRIIAIQRYQEAGPAQNPELPTLTQANANTIQTIPHVYDVLPSDIETIVMIPPIHGDLGKFIEILQYLFKTEIFRKENSSDLRLKNGVAVICMAPFYKENNIYGIILLMYLQMKLWDSNQNTFFVLSDPTEIQLAKFIHQPGNGVNLNPPNDILFPNLNPTYIIYPKEFGTFKGILFTSEYGQNLQIPKKDKVPTFASASSSMEKHPTFAIHPAQGDTFDDTFKDFLLVGSRGYKTDLIAARTDVPLCRGLDTIFYDEDFSVSKQYLISNKKNQIHIFRYNRIQEPPLLCFDEDGDIANLIPPPGAFAAKENHPRFAKVNTISIMVDAIERKIRDPSLGNVLENWNTGIFSKGEADFLNSLQLTPSLLSFVFDANWKKETADFLYKVAVSKCFTDVRIITQAECDSVRTFLNKVLAYFYAHAAFKLDQPPIQRIVQPKIIVEEPAPILEVPPPPPLPPATAPGLIVWPDQAASPNEWVEAITADRFDKKKFGDISQERDANDYKVDFIAVSKQDGSHFFKRLHLPHDVIDDRVKQTGRQVVDYITDAMDTIKQRFGNDFYILY